MRAAEVHFESEIKPLFREKDRISMLGSFDLWSYSDVKAHAEAIGVRLKDGSMPCDGAWSPEWVRLFECWVVQGKLQ
jgi:hypothetical protein